MLLRFFIPDLKREGQSQSRMVLDLKKRKNKQKKRKKKGKTDSLWASLGFCCYCKEISKVRVTESALKVIAPLQGR